MGLGPFQLKRDEAGSHLHSVHECESLTVDEPSPDAEAAIRLAQRFICSAVAGAEHLG
jgi:hypothetical protein